MTDFAFTDEGRRRVLYWARKGRAIRAGFQVLVEEAAKQGSTLSIEEAFFAGAGFCFALQLVILDEGREPTDQDMELMTKLHAEIEEFDNKLRLMLTSAASNRPS